MTDEGEFKRFARRATKFLRPKIASSAHVIVVAPDQSEADVKIALEIGYTILLDKPLIVFKPPGRTVAPRLLRIADKVIEVDMKDEAAMERAADELKRFMNQ